MTKLETKSAVLLNIAAAMVMPILGIVISSLAILNRRRPSWLALAISLSLIYSYLPLLWDARNNFFLIYIFRDIDFNLYTNSIDLLVNRLGLQYIFSLFLIGIITIYILGKFIGGEIFEKYVNDKLYFFICMIMLLMALEYRSIFDLQKTTLALAVCVLAFSCKNKNYHYAFSVIAVLIHPLSLIVVALFTLGRVSQVLSYRAWVGILIVGIIIATVLTSDRLAGFGADAGIISGKVGYYLAERESRFSSEGIADLVWALRAFACLTVAIACIIQMQDAKDFNEKWLLSFLASLAIFTLCFSRHEIFVERYFIALVIFSAFVFSRIRFRTILALAMMAAIVSNVGMHGLYTIALVHSGSYDVIMNSSERREMSVRGLYYPTALLLDYKEVGYSDYLIMYRASIN